MDQERRYAFIGMPCLTTINIVNRFFDSQCTRINHVLRTGIYLGEIFVYHCYPARLFSSFMNHAPDLALEAMNHPSFRSKVAEVSTPTVPIPTRGRS
jgi:hypothetical protein